MIIGIDMGGTNIDGVAISNGKLVTSVKHPVDRNDYFQSIWGCLSELLRGVDKDTIERIHLSTTISTNAIVEDQVAEVGVILQTGPGLKWPFERIGEHLVYLSGSVDHRGKLVQQVTTDELEKAKSRFAQDQVEAIAVISKFSTRNPELEQRVKELFQEDYREITMGHTLSGKLNFPRRVHSAYLNAAVSKTFRTFAENMQKALSREGIDAPVYILKADGGTIDLMAATEKPVETILSGPAASFMGMSALLDDIESDSCLLDIGGTTTDLFFLVDGVPIFEPAGIEIDGRKTLVRAIFSTSVGLGGDSYVRFEDGKLMIGPRRLDSAIAFGGTTLTPTDALVYLDKMEAQYPDESLRAIEAMAKEQNMSPSTLAHQIIQTFVDTIEQTIHLALEKINGGPVYTIKELLRDRFVKPQSVGMIGGPSKALAPYLEDTLKMPVTYPSHYEIANAIGAALAKPTMEISLLADTDRKILSIPELEIYEQIDRSFDLEKAKRIVISELQHSAEKYGLTADASQIEITEASSFNMIKGYYGADKNIRVKAQIRPGLLSAFVDE